MDAANKKMKTAFVLITILKMNNQCKIQDGKRISSCTKMLKRYFTT
jgi:hypothetical protein